MPTILILSSNYFMRTIVQHQLVKDANNVRVVKTFEEAWKALKEQHIDLLFFQATMEHSDDFLEDVSSAYPTMPIVTCCFFNREKINTLEKLTGFYPLAIPFTEEHITEKVRQVLT